MTSKFERDKVYKLRNGEIRTVIYTAGTGKKAIVLLGPDGSLSTRYEDGRIFAGEDNGHDLMLPKPEPVVEWGVMTSFGFDLCVGGEQHARGTSRYSAMPLAKRVTTFED